MNFNNVAFVTSCVNPEQLKTWEQPEIVFSGRSNVGKSTLINKIFNRKNLARVSSVPGKTAAVNYFSCENLMFADLPGYGYAKVSKTEKARWSKLIDRYFSDEGRQISLVFQLIDYRHAPSADDLMMIDFLQQSEIPYALVLTKADKLTKSQRVVRLDGFTQEIPAFAATARVEFSAQTGEGAERLREIIQEIAKGSS